MNLAYACRITSDNFNAIASEMPGFDKDQLIVWLEEHESGYFIRDEWNKSFDCTLMADLVFHTIYGFEDSDEGQLFRKIIKL